MHIPVDWPLSDLVSRRAQTVPNRTALVCAETEQTWTYREWSSGPVDTLAAGIRAAGLAPGSHLGTLLEPGVQLAHLVHAAARAGAVFVPLPPDAPPETVGHRSAVADIDALVCGAATEPTAVTGFDGPVYAVDEPRSSAVESLREGSADGPTTHKWALDEVQWLVFTSGTAGEPKAVRLTSRNLVASATASAFRLGVSPDDRWLACLPMHHVGGLAPLVRSALYGTTVVVQPTFAVDRAAQAMSNLGVTAVSLVPTMLRRLLDAGWSPPDTLRFVLLGGAPAPPGLVERWAAAGVPVCPTYGATETASQVATARPTEAVEHAGSVGRPLPGIEVVVRDAEGAALPPGEPGELVVAGPVVAAGYYHSKEATQARFDDGSFATRDRGYRDDGGRLWVLGRLDDAIVTGGETVHPGTVEAALRTHPAVDDAAVVGLHDEEWGEVIAALVVGPDAGNLAPSTLQDHCRERLEPHAVPKVVATVTELPRTASGTVDRVAVRDALYEAGRAEEL